MGGAKRQTPVLQEAPPVRIAANSGLVESGAVDYRDMESPTIIRRDRLADRQAAKSYVTLRSKRDGLSRYSGFSPAAGRLNPGL